MIIIKPNFTALMFGTFAATVHVVWSLVVFLGLGQTYINWMTGLHFISIPVKVAPFNLMTALTLIVVTFVLGYLIGWVFATVWNRVQKAKQS